MIYIIILHASFVKRGERKKMSGSNLQHLAALIVYMAAVIGIGLYFSKRANRDTEAYFLGGRSLGRGSRHSARRRRTCRAIC